MNISIWHCKSFIFSINLLFLSHSSVTSSLGGGIFVWLSLLRGCFLISLSFHLLKLGRVSGSSSELLALALLFLHVGLIGRARIAGGRLGPLLKERVVSDLVSATLDVRWVVDVLVPLDSCSNLLINLGCSIFFFLGEGAALNPLKFNVSPSLLNFLLVVLDLREGVGALQWTCSLRRGIGYPQGEGGGG